MEGFSKEEKGRYYCGIPVLTFDEYSFLMLDNEFHSLPDSVSFKDIGSRVLGVKSLHEYIDQDIDFWLSYEAYGYSDEQEVFYGTAVLEGYSVTFGALIMGQYFRDSKGLGIDEYLKSLPLHADFIPLTEKSLSMAKALRRGSEFFPREPTEINDNPLLDLGDIMFENTRLEELIEIEIQSLYQTYTQDLSDKENEDAFTAGFFHGVREALQLMIVSNEQRVFDRMALDPS